MSQAKLQLCYFTKAQNYEILDLIKIIKKYNFLILSNL